MLGLLEIVRTVVHNLWDKFDLYILCLYRKDVYLRKRGMCIGQGCNLITDIANFGTEPFLIRMGEKVTVTSGVKFITHDASTRLFRDRFPEMNRYGNLFAPIIIGRNCFIGVNTILLPGSVIGNDSIIGAGAVVKGSFPGNSVIAGIPARRISSLDEFIDKVRDDLLPLQANDRKELQQELIAYFFDKEEKP